MKIHEDTRDLMILAGHAAGETVWEISCGLDCTSREVRSRLSELLRADIAHDPLAKEYWTNL